MPFGVNDNELLVFYYHISTLYRLTGFQICINVDQVWYGDDHMSFSHLFTNY